ncbi:inositol-pentakisphosphate 2-kinase [Aplysia californica]|uniref:Inositol-pentakisphosphate 2-kinase n=1 Tax=Aplysia californica TaxID=6500 RepID=A0ABM1A2P6_APLCA|nr:inositol-pentakisphosphate 2-kinase [Aplysia californica]
MLIRWLVKMNSDGRSNRQRMKHALFSLIKTPQNNLKICRNGKELYGSEIREDLNAVLQEWFPYNPSRRQKLRSVFVDLVIEILLHKGTGCHHSNKEATDSQPGSPLGSGRVQKCQSSSFIHFEEDQAHKLPQGCVLERIFSIQSLDDLGIEKVFPLYKRLKARMEAEPGLREKWGLNGPYDDLSWLLGSQGEQLEDLDPGSEEYDVLKVKRFLISKTLQDCSIIVAIKPAGTNESIKSMEDYLRFEGDLYDFSVSIVDLDPKPFEKVKTYFRQATDIASAFSEMPGSGYILACHGTGS